MTFTSTPGRTQFEHRVDMKFDIVLKTYRGRASYLSLSRRMTGQDARERNESIDARISIQINAIPYVFVFLAKFPHAIILSQLKM